MWELWNATQVFHLTGPELSPPICELCIQLNGCSTKNRISYGQKRAVLSKLSDMSQEPPCNAARQLLELASLCLCSTCKRSSNSYRWLIDEWKTKLCDAMGDYLRSTLLEYKNLKIQATQLDQSSESQRESLQEMSEHCDDLNSTIGELRLALSKADQERALLGTQNQDLNSQLQAQCRISELQVSEIRNLLESHNQAVDERTSLEQQNSNLKSQLEEQCRAMELQELTSKNSLDTHQKEISQLRSQFADEKNQFADELIQLANSKKPSASHSSEPSSTNRPNLQLEIEHASIGPPNYTEKAVFLKACTTPESRFKSPSVFDISPSATVIGSEDLKDGCFSDSDVFDGGEDAFVQTENDGDNDDVQTTEVQELEVFSWIQPIEAVSPISTSACISLWLLSTDCAVEDAGKEDRNEGNGHLGADMHIEAGLLEKMAMLKI